MRRTGDANAKLFLLCAVLAAGAMAGCVYTWRPYWWNFYDRGLSRASEGQLQDAAQDFETAIGKRKGATVSRPEDARRVRTYGMHFIDDYFPHRELGVAYYRMKRFEEAERELAASLEQTPSAKAKMYLNLVRKERLREKPAQDEPPLLRLTVPSGMYLNSDRIDLAGVAQSKNYISSILVNGERLFVELARQKMEFSKALRLKPGANEVVVEAMDLVGKSTTRRVVLNVDRQYPAVAIEDAVTKGPNTAAIRGVVMDNAGISKLVIQGRQQAIERPSTEMEFSLDAAIGHTITVEVADLAGNTTSARILITADMLQPGEGGASRPIFLAMLGSDRLADTGETGIFLSQEARARDRTPPTIVIRDVAEERVIYDEELIFEGLARDNGRLAALSVNGEDILGRRMAVLVKYFTYRASLTEGVNQFKIVAVDEAGNRAEKNFRVVRKIQEPLQVAARLTLALLPLQENGSSLSATSQMYGLLLGSFLDCGRFNFVEREQTAFQALLTELKIGNSELADKRTAVRIGRMKTAEGMLYGKTIENERSITVDLWLVDTETTEILFFADVYGEDKSRDELKWLVDGLVLKFKQHFPLVRGKVTNVTDTGVFIDNGSLDGIWPGMKYLVLKENGQGNTGALRMIPVDGRVLQARVTTVQPRSCFAAFAEKGAANLVKVNYPVITK